MVTLMLSMNIINTSCRAFLNYYSCCLADCIYKGLCDVHFHNNSYFTHMKLAVLKKSHIGLACKAVTVNFIDICTSQVLA